jgi:AcrR family transcriptional regulator
MATDPFDPPRTPLNRHRVLRAAMDLADREGIDAVTMRRLGQELGIEAMSLYHHVADKEAILGGLVDLLVAEIAPATPGAEWKAALRERAMSAHEMVRRHPWAPRLILSRPNMRPSLLHYMDWLNGELLDAGFSHAIVHEAGHALGSHMLGFTQELFDPRDFGPEFARSFLAEVQSGAYPRIAEALVGVHHDDDVEFAFGLDLLLDGLERLRNAAGA